MKAKKALKTDPANRRSPAERPNTNGKTCEWVTVMDCNMTCAVGKRMRQRLTIRVQPPPQAVGCDEKLERDDKNVNDIYRSFFFLFVRRKGRGL